MKKVIYVLLVLHAFVGLGAIGGGMMAILNPKTPGGMPIDALNNSPFRDFLIPGIILFTIMGLGNILCVISMLLKSKYQGYISSIFSFALVIWIIVQCIMLRKVYSLHVIFFIIGFIQAFLSVILLFMQHLFPTNKILKIFKKLENTYPNNIFLKSIGKLLNKMSDTDCYIS